MKTIVHSRTLAVNCEHSSVRRGGWNRAFIHDARVNLRDSCSSWFAALLLCHWDATLSVCARSLACKCSPEAGHLCQHPRRARSPEFFPHYPHHPRSFLKDSSTSSRTSPGSFRRTIVKRRGTDAGQMASVLSSFDIRREFRAFLFSYGSGRNRRLHCRCG